MAGLQHGLGAVIIIVVMLLVEGGPRTETAAAWGALGYMAAFSSLTPMLLYYWLLTKVSATYASSPATSFPRSR